MTFDMTPRTDAGRRLVAAAENLVPGLRERADEADRIGQICAENYQAIIGSGVAAAFVPEELGGFGLTSVHDWILAIATLGRGDGSTAIAINMHLAVSRGLAEAFRSSKDRGAPAEDLAGMLSAIVAGEMLICATATERGTDNLHPLTEATRVEQGWRIDGRKMFVTMSPVATHIAMNLRMRDADDDRIGTTMLPLDTPGIVPQDDWDALGMRASGSQSVQFDDVRVPEQSVRPLAPWGRWSVPMLLNRALANLPLVGAFLGIAEAAHELAIAAVNAQKRAGQPVNELAGVQHTVGEIEIELATCRSVLQQAGAGVDAFLDRHQGTTPTVEAAHELMKDYQAAKWVVNQGAIDIVSKCMDLLGGGGFMTAHPLSRLYRDVRAGPFMQPYSPTEAREYVGRVALGLYPDA